MRLLADENVPGETVEALRQQGHDVVWVRADSPGLGDNDVLRRAGREERIVVTLDKDFGELIFSGRIVATTGVILLRLRVPDPTRLTQIVVAALASREDWSGHFSVVENDRVRMTPLP
jgi:predicted nuclease of predicted toxin-antitoxin system